ncbi:glycosyltransferase [Allocoleopsis sp.]|uniref:glycosyltransferase n=1 Tax=Allocoleopsis sp. TaxID=3088169 RepID=UPI002FD00B2C
MKKRLLLISSNSSGRGGGERYLVYLTQGLRLLECEVHVLLSNVSYMDNWVKVLTAEGAQVHRRELIGLRSRPLRFVQSISDKKQQLKIAEVCKEVAPDAILVNQQYDEDGLDYLAGALMSGVAPVGGTMHMPMTADKDKRPLGRWRGKLLHHWYEKHPYSLIFVSEGSQREFESYYKYPRPTNVVHYGCPFPESHPLLKLSTSNLCLPKDWTDNRPVIGFVGQFVSQKNLQLLVDGWQWAIKQGVETRLLLVGDGPERDALEKRLINNAPRNTWHITGWTEQAEKYLSVVDIYAMTSHFEGLPLALIEAVGRGLPAIITNFNGASDVAKRATWVTVIQHNRPDSVGRAIIEVSNTFSSLKQQAIESKKVFQNYFLVQRMASDTLAVFGIN